MLTKRQYVSFGKVGDADAAFPAVDGTGRGRSGESDLGSMQGIRALYKYEA